MSRRRLTLVLGILATIGPLSIDAVLPSFASIAHSFGASAGTVQLTLAAYLAGIAAGQLVHGAMSDRFGRRAPLIAGLGLYALAAAACAVAPSFAALVVGRFGQGVGACAVIVVSRAVVRDRCSDDESATLYSWRMLVMGVVPVLAPFLGAAITASIGWRGVFAGLAAVGSGLLVLVLRALPESLPEHARKCTGVGETLRGMGAALRSHAFVRYSIAGGLSEAAMFGCMAGVPSVLESFGVAPENVGVLTAANALGIVAVSQANRSLVRGIGTRRALRVGTAAAVVSYAALALAVVSGAGLAITGAAIVLGVATVGSVLPNSTAAAMDATGGRVGTASALLGLMQSTCDALAALAVSAFADGTARPMTVVMLTCGLAALALAWRRGDCPAGSLARRTLHGPSPLDRWALCRGTRGRRPTRRDRLRAPPGGGPP